MKNTYVVCYNGLDVFHKKQDAINFYRLCFCGSEGSEHERYANILVDLMYCDIGLDNVDEVVWNVRYFDSNNNVIRKEKIEYTNYKKVIEEIEKRGD